MGKFALAIAGAALLAPAIVSAQTAPAAPPAEKAPAADPATEATNRVVAYSAWDDDYFYVALQVNKPNLSGRNNRAFSRPLEDDAIIIGLQTDNDQTATKRTAKTITIAVSAAGGTQVYTGAGAKPLYNGLEDFQTRLADIYKNETDPAVKQTRAAALMNSLIKVAVTQKGAMRAIGTPASGYTIELAIPWSDLGGKPQNETRMGFHIAAQSVAEGSPPLQNLSPRIATRADADNPSLWEQIVFRNAPAVMENGLYVSPRIFGGKPAIDGELSNGEWNGLTRLAFGSNAGAAGTAVLPATYTARFHPKFTPAPARPAVPMMAPLLANPAPHQKQAVSPLALAEYTYWYQGDSRKSAPAERVWQPNGATALAQHPLNGSGPWLSYDRAEWHRQQLIEARRAGIDVILPVYRGGVRDRQRYADKGLLALATALQALKSAGQDYPQVGMMLDTTALPEIFGEKADLGHLAAQNALYTQIRDFYRAIPAPFRYGLNLSAASGGRIAYPVFLTDADTFKNIEADFATFLRSRFAADFDGADLLIIGAAGFAPNAKLDGYFGSVRQAKGGSFAYNADGWIKIATLGAGLDTTFTTAAGDAPIIKPRRGGETYRAAWKSAIEQRPDWVLIDGWNDFTNGANLAPSIEVGYAEDDQTKIRARQFAGNTPRNIKFLWNDAPSALLPGAVTNVHVRAQNSGLEAWSPFGAVGAVPTVFSYRWRRGDQVVATGAKVNLSASVGSGENVDATLAVAANDSSGSPLPAGDYVLEIGAARDVSERRGLDWMGGGLRVSVRIGDTGAAWAATVTRSNLPRMVEAGGVYSVTATLRNDGAAAWRKSDGARIGLRLSRTERAAVTGSESPAFPSSATETPVDAADASVALTQDVAPGHEVTVSLQFPLMDAKGRPLPLWTQESPWIYTVRWEVAASGSEAAGQTVAAQTVAAGNAALVNAPAGVSFAPTPIAVTQYDFGVRFTSDGTPAALPGQKRLPVRLSLSNVGPQTWKSDAARVGYHWYYADGTEFLWEDETTPLTQFLPKGQKEVRPGETVTDLLAWVTAPPYDGTYWLVWDVKVGDTWNSTTETARAFDEIARPVKVLGGKLAYADLTRAYNTDGVSEDDETFDGDLDGTGKTLPAALTPPFADMTIAPSGMGLPTTAVSGPESPRRIGFRWGPKDTGAKNFIACRGQRVELGKANGTVRVLHLLATSTGKDTLSELKLVFQEPSSQSQDAYVFAVSPWDRPPTRNDEIAFVARRYHDRKGTHPGALALYHYTLKIRDPRNLIGLILPDSPDIKIAAITLEK